MSKLRDRLNKVYHQSSTAHPHTQRNPSTIASLRAHVQSVHTEKPRFYTCLLRYIDINGVHMSSAYVKYEYT